MVFYAVFEAVDVQERQWRAVRLWFKMRVPKEGCL